MTATSPTNPKHIALIDFLKRIPAIDTSFFSCGDENGLWWVKFKIDIHHKLSWHAIQELGYIVNYVSLNERLPTSFYPVSPPPYMNGGPAVFLSWIIENTDPTFSPDDLTVWLENRLPKPVEDENEWITDDTENE